MKTSGHKKTATLSIKNLIALVTTSVFLSVLIGESRKLAKDYRTWLTWVLVAMVTAVLAATASTLWRHRSRKPDTEL